MNEDLDPENGGMPGDETGACGPVTTPEEAKASSGAVSAFQERMDRWTDGVGRGALRGTIDTIVIVWALMFLYVIRGFYVYKPPFSELTIRSLSEFLSEFVLGGIVVSIVFLPFGVVIGGLLGALGLFPKKKKTSEPKKTESAETSRSDWE